MKSTWPIAPKSKGHTAPCRATWGSSGVSGEAKGARGGHDPEPSLWFSQERMSETGWASWSNLGLSSVKNFNSVWAGGWSLVAQYPALGWGRPKRMWNWWELDHRSDWGHGLWGGFIGPPTTCARESHLPPLGISLSWEGRCLPCVSKTPTALKTSFYIRNRKHDLYSRINLCLYNLLALCRN